MKVFDSKRVIGALNNLAVSAYKGLGFVILAVILFALVSYMSVQGFFLVARAWIAPIIIQPSDPRVLLATTQLAQQATTHDKLLAERRDLLSRLELNARSTEVLTAFQGRFGQALQSEVADRHAELARLSKLNSQLLATRDELERSSAEWAQLTRVQSKELYGARLIDRETMVKAGYQLSQLELGNLSLSERAITLETRLGALRREIAEREALRAGAAAPLGWESLLVARELARGQLEVERLAAERELMQASLTALEASLVQYERVVRTLERSPYRRASEHGVALGFVPYENLGSVAEGAPLFHCALGMFWCSPAGTLTRMIEGEVNARHPVRNRDLRGVLVELELGELRWAEGQVLFVGKPPLLF